MEVDLQSLFGLHVTWCAQLAETPQPPPPPCIWTRITRALLVSKDIRHLCVTPVFQVWILRDPSFAVRVTRHFHPEQDPAFHVNADPDPASQVSKFNIYWEKKSKKHILHSCTIVPKINIIQVLKFISVCLNLRFKMQIIFLVYTVGWIRI